LTSDDFNFNRTLTKAQLVASNIMPIPGGVNAYGSTPRVFLQDVGLANPALTRVGDLQVDAYGWQCNHWESTGGEVASGWHMWDVSVVMKHHEIINNSQMTAATHLERHERA
jgi:hypothetical protein